MVKGSVPPTEAHSWGRVLVRYRCVSSWVTHPETDYGVSLNGVLLYGLLPYLMIAEWLKAEFSN